MQRGIWRQFESYAIQEKGKSATVVESRPDGKKQLERGQCRIDQVAGQVTFKQLEQPAIPNLGEG
jgi:hypothetical protein